MLPNVGDRVKVTITGTIVSPRDNDTRACNLIEDADGAFHYVFFTAEDKRPGFKVKLLEGVPNPRQLAAMVVDETIRGLGFALADPDIPGDIAAIVAALADANLLKEEV